ncbi:hypothetical protein NYZ99_17890 [Maribacter litopenaei]|uniref:Uncharacterized protein n=1 Tax=Maribacter litopenaei TaxID=2976127 RepID=A0ABY5Y750_9FLAO|nr:hypothetical protein [Maribacter litopenaei]UWX54693.1 hypothetical protein NYZ99_17890 [Maribacter litopenaei]
MKYSTKGEEMEWQEYYVFNPDGSFLKSREQNGTVLEATGTFEMVEFDNDDADYLELTFTTGKELATSCFSYEGIEILRYISNRKLESMWKACDGSDLYYDLVID